jgi:hypothetical protein
MYGAPDVYGLTSFQIVELKEDTWEWVNDYTIERETFFRPIHRYDRKARFVSTLNKLIGLKGNVPDFVMERCRTLMLTRESAWERVRMVLKRNGWSRYYDNIPLILRNLGKERMRLTCLGK